ncbi:hypothetical protein RRF57_007181 [Xylaria bambusicola]|uniref:Uncharacterized protein n=1 Tax=Xylaria bambusicola TaxID=326684 RepID=A0AAN7UMD0_9PEZI
MYLVAQYWGHRQLYKQHRVSVTRTTLRDPRLRAPVVSSERKRARNVIANLQADGMYSHEEVKNEMGSL